MELCEEVQGLLDGVCRLHKLICWSGILLGLGHGLVDGSDDLVVAGARSVLAAHYGSLAVGASEAVDGLLVVVGVVAWAGDDLERVLLEVPEALGEGDAVELVVVVDLGVLVGAGRGDLVLDVQVVFALAQHEHLGVIVSSHTRCFLFSKLSSGKL